jgi:hypothetical protein
MRTYKVSSFFIIYILVGDVKKKCDILNKNNDERRRHMPENRGKTGKFTKGTSGNPGGRPKIDPKVKKILESATVDAAQALVDMLSSGNPQYIIRAAETILDRVYGKPAQSVAIDGEVKNNNKTVIEFKGDLEKWSR